MNNVVRSEEAHPLYGALSRCGFNAIQLAYNHVDWMAQINIQRL